MFDSLPLSPPPPSLLARQIDKMADIASSHGLFGGNCTYERVHKELLGYSDHQLHTFSSECACSGACCLHDGALLLQHARISLEWMREGGASGTTPLACSSSPGNCVCV